VVSNVNSNKTPYSYSLNNQASNENKTGRKNLTFNNVDRIDISIDALRASQNVNTSGLLDDEPEEEHEPIEKLLEEYKNSGVISETKSEDDSIAAAARMKMTAMKIAMRISKGDIVPMQDHRFLAEYDSALYKAAMNASVVANNKDPERHESLADELAAYEAEKANRSSAVDSTESEITDGEAAVSEAGTDGEAAGEATSEAVS